MTKTLISDFLPLVWVSLSDPFMVGECQREGKNMKGQ